MVCNPILGSLFSDIDEQRLLVRKLDRAVASGKAPFGIELSLILW